MPFGCAARAARMAAQFEVSGRFKRSLPDQAEDEPLSLSLLNHLRPSREIPPQRNCG